MRRSKPNLNILMILVLITGILISDGIAAYLRLTFPVELVVYLAWGIPMYYLSRMIRRKLQKRNAENE